MSSILIVGLPHDRVPIEGRENGAKVTVVRVDDYASAARALAEAIPDVLITNLRLGTHNGLHLVLRGKHTQPGMVALVVAEHDDTVLRRDAEALGARFIIKRVSSAELETALTEAGLDA